MVALEATARQKQWLSENRVVALYTLDPLAFLRLTCNSYFTLGFTEVDWFLWSTRPLSFYQSTKVQDSMVEHPFLELDREGRVVRHEGRHRAAAIKKAGGDTYEIAILSEYGVPDRIVAQSDTSIVHEVNHEALRYEFDGGARSEN